jgi:hypothetical protein
MVRGAPWAKFHSSPLALTAVFVPSSPAGNYGLRPVDGSPPVDAAVVEGLARREPPRRPRPGTNA